MLPQTIPEGLGLGVLLIAVCAVGIRAKELSECCIFMTKMCRSDALHRGLTTKEQIKRNALRFKAVCIPIYLAYDESDDTGEAAKAGLLKGVAKA